MPDTAQAPYPGTFSLHNVAELYFRNFLTEVEKDAWKRMIPVSPWLGLLQQEQWVKENGFVHEIEGTEPMAIDSKANFTVLNEHTATYLPKPEMVRSNGWRARRYALGLINFRTVDLNLIKLTNTKDSSAQLKNYFDNAESYVSQKLANLHEQFYAGMVDHKMILDSKEGDNPNGLFVNRQFYPNGFTTWRRKVATSVLTPRMLQLITRYLNRENTTNGRVNYTTTRQLLTSFETSEFVLNGGATYLDREKGILTSDRQTINYVDAAAKQILEMYNGTPFTKDGVQHVVLEQPTRLDWDKEARDYVYIFPNKRIVTNKGGQMDMPTEYSVPNQDYEEAPFEMSYIFSKDVCSVLTADINNYQNGIGQGAANFGGKWEWYCPESSNNEYKINGYLRWQKFTGVKPRNTSNGAAIVHLRKRYVDLYSSAMGNLIANGEKNTDDKVINGTQLIADLDEGGTPFEGLEAYTRMFVSVPVIETDGTNIFTALPEPLPYHVEWVYPSGFNSTTDTAHFEEGAVEMVMYAHATPIYLGDNGKPVALGEVTAAVTTKTEGDVTVECRRMNEGNRFWEIKISRANATTAVNVEVTLSCDGHNDQPDGNNKLTIVG